MISTRQLFFSNLAQTTDAPLGIEAERASGNYIYTKKGEKLLDLIAGISVSNVGHLHPHVTAAIKNQLEKHLHLQVYGEYIQTPQVNLATKLLEKLPNNFESVYLVNSGSEAIEGALKLAKRFTGRHEIFAFKNAYHGSTHGALSVMGNEEFKRPFRPLLPGIKHFDFNSTAIIDQISTKTAAVLIEPVQGEAGYIPAEIEFMRALKKRCQKTGTLLIFDEIQTGLGRTGKWFALEHYNVKPDIITLAKGLGGGMPIGAFISSKKIMDTLKENPILGHITTFGGHPLSCAAAHATLEVIENDNLLADISEKEKAFRNGLKHPEIKSISGTGLMLAVELDSFEKAEKTMHKCLAAGVITDWFLFNENSIRIAPPLTITLEEINFACNVICKALDS